MIQKSKRYTNTVYCKCNNYDDYLTFAKELYTYKEPVMYLGEHIYDEPWFGEMNISQWMDTFNIPYIKVDPEDEYSDEVVIENPLTDTYIIQEKPNDNEYPVMVIAQKVNEIQIDWVSLQ